MEGPLCILSKNIHILKPGLYHFYNNSNSKTSLDNVFDCSGSVFRLLLYQQPIGGGVLSQPKGDGNQTLVNILAYQVAVRCVQC